MITVNVTPSPKLHGTVRGIIYHNGKKEKRCDICEAFWASLTTSARREIMHNIEFDEDI